MNSRHSSLVNDISVGSEVIPDITAPKYYLNQEEDSIMKTQYLLKQSSNNNNMDRI